MSPILYTNIEGHRIQLHCGVIKPSPALLADRRLSLLRQGSSVLLFPHKSSYLPCFQFPGHLTLLGYLSSYHLRHLFSIHVLSHLLSNLSSRLTLLNSHNTH